MEDKRFGSKEHDGPEYIDYYDPDYDTIQTTAGTGKPGTCSELDSTKKYETVLSFNTHKQTSLL